MYSQMLLFVFFVGSSMHGAATPSISQVIRFTGTLPGLALDLALVRFWSVTQYFDERKICLILYYSFLFPL
jgi:hypothetical protein